MANLERILIVGGGIAGLTLATALHRHGYSAELVERSPTWRAIGAGILLHANGMRMLRALDLGTPVEQAGAVVRRWSFCDQQGELLCETDLQALWGKVGPCIGIARASLQEVLLAGAAIPCRLGTAITSLTQDEQRVWVSFSDGSSGDYDLVVGADGLASTVRRLTLDATPPGYTGLMVWRGLAPHYQPNMQVLLGEGCVFGLVPMGNGQTYGFGIAGSPRLHDPLEGRLERARSRFAAFGGPVPAYLASLSCDEQLHCAPIEWVELEQWHVGRIVLVGDAAHAGPPMMAQGGSMAMKDACVLAEVLDEAESVESALSSYASRRRPRADWVQQQSRAWAESYRLPPANRDAILREQRDWQSLFWLLIPVVFLLVLWNIPPRNNKFSLDSMDKSVSKFLHSRVRRFDRTPEPGEPRTTKPEHEAIVPQKKPAVSLKSHTSPVTFADVAGIDEVRADLEEVVQFLRSPSKFNRLGAHIPRGILLVGAPGTGKTLLAKAVAGEANVPFFPMSASEFIEMFVGVGASRVRDLFQQARQSAPCVIFLDEIDAIGRKRSIKVTGNGERDQTLNQLLVELDGFNSRSTVIVLAATNHVDILDTALLRPGRFDRQITISLPDRVGREAILRVHTRTTPLHSSVQLESLARQTTGMSGADLANLVNEAALTAARRSLDCVTQACFEEALERIQLGARRPLILGKADQRIIAFHESGHALVAYYLPEADSVSSISMLPRGQHLGVTQFTTQEDRYNFSRETLMARLAVGLGGRVAEELTFGPGGVTTGAENDLQAVTALAWRMVTHWGMGKQVGTVFADYCEAGGAHLQYLATQPVQSSLAKEQVAGYLHTYHAHTPATRFISSPTMATLIDAEVQHILNDGHETARALLTAHCTQLTRLAQALMEHEQLNRVEFEEVLQQ